MIYTSIYFSLRQKVRNGREGIFSALKNKMTLRKIRMKDLCVLMKNAEWKRRKGREGKREGTGGRVEGDEVRRNYREYWTRHMCANSASASNKKLQLDGREGALFMKGIRQRYSRPSDFAWRSAFGRLELCTTVHVLVHVVYIFLLPHLFSRVHCLFSFFAASTTALKSFTCRGHPPLIKSYFFTGDDKSVWSESNDVLYLRKFLSTRGRVSVQFVIN